MLTRFISGSLLITFLITSTVFGNLSESTDKERMLQTLDIIRNSFYVQYAPVEWKQKYSGWELDHQIDHAKNKVIALENPSIKDFQGVVRDFFSSTQDYHVGVSFYSTESASLPFRVKGANGKYFISYIDRSKLSSTVFPFKVGDELTRFDGKPTHDVVTELKNREVGNASELTDYAMSEMFLTHRVGQIGHQVPKGPVMVTVKSTKTGHSSSFQLIWQYQPEKIVSKAVTSLEDTSNPVKSKVCALTQKGLLAPFYQTISTPQIDNDKDEDGTLGARKGFIPTLGKKWWESDSTSAFHAYLYETHDRHLVGYVRIPHYVGSADDAEEFSKIVAFMQDRSDALVIDQTNNPGGSVFYLYALVSMLTDQPLSAPRHKMTITQKEVMDAVYCVPAFEKIRSDEDAKAVLGKTLDGNQVTYQMAQFFLNYFRFIIDEWNEGRILTKPFYLYGVDHINPHPKTRYTKPILVLTNSLDFSGGDFFPAILQDNHRVTILGERTAGAGGFVIGTSFPNHFGIAGYHYTASIAERADSNPIENLGVEPDIPYSLTEVDLTNGYSQYVQEIHQAVDQMLQNN